MAFAENRAAFFADFGVDALIGGASVRGLFSAPYAESFGMGGTAPVFEAETARVANVARGAVITIAGTNYHVAEIRPDGTGMTALILETE